MTQPPEDYEKQLQRAIESRIDTSFPAQLREALRRSDPAEWRFKVPPEYRNELAQVLAQFP